MGECCLIVNRSSGSHDPACCEAINQALQRHRRQPVRTITIPEDPMISAAQARADNIELIAIFAGDGTVSAAVDALEGWEGCLLILPGGTMNLLSRKLHGEAEPEAIIKAAFGSAARRVTLPVAEGCGVRSLVGIVAGPTAAWGDVREDLRKLDLGGLVESVPDALQETLQGEPVSVDGVEGQFQAIFIDPREDALEANAINAGTAAELLQHGWAWLRGDFRDGPQTPMFCVRTITLRREGDIDLLVDGEQARAASPCQFTLGRSGLTFLTARKPQASE